MRGYTTTQCGICKKERIMHGDLQMALTIWNVDEGLVCCGYQTDIVHQEIGDLQ